MIVQFFLHKFNGCIAYFRLIGFVGLLDFVLSSKNILVQVHNQSISETTFGMVSDFIGSFTMFPKKDEPRGTKTFRFNPLFLQMLEILTSPCPVVDETFMQNLYAVRQAAQMRELGMYTCQFIY
jgi:hypothetical protein